MRVQALFIASVALIGMLGDVGGAYAQSRTLPKGSSLAATPPIDQRGKQFHALSHASQRKYLRQGYQPHRHPY